MSETQHFQAAETPGEHRIRPSYALASPEFFHLLSRIDQLDNKMEQKIERLEQCLEQTEQRLEQRLEQTEQRFGQRLQQTEQKIDKLQGWIIATLLAVALSTIGLVLFK